MKNVLYLLKKELTIYRALSEAIDYKRAMDMLSEESYQSRKQYYEEVANEIETAIELIKNYEATG